METAPPRSIVSATRFSGSMSERSNASCAGGFEPARADPLSASRTMIFEPPKPKSVSSCARAAGTLCVRCQREDARTGMKMGPQARDFATVERHADDILKRPSQRAAARLKADGAGNDAHLLRGNMPCEVAPTPWQKDRPRRGHRRAVPARRPPPRCPARRGLARHALRPSRAFPPRRDDAHPRTRALPNGRGGLRRATSRPRHPRRCRRWTATPRPGSVGRSRPRFAHARSPLILSPPPAGAPAGRHGGCAPPRR